MRLLTLILAMLMLAVPLGSCGHRPKNFVPVSTPSKPPVPDELMRTPPGPPEMADKGRETGATAAAHNRPLLAYSRMLWEWLVTLQDRVAARETAEQEQAMREAGQ